MRVNLGCAEEHSVDAAVASKIEEVRQFDCVITVISQFCLDRGREDFFDPRIHGTYAIDVR